MRSAVSTYVRQHHLALLCLFLILGGGSAYAVNGPLAGKNTVGSADIINDEVRKADIAPGSVTPAETGTVPAALVAGGSDSAIPVAGTGAVADFEAIPFDDDTFEGSRDFDTDGMHSYTTDPELFTVNTPGIYLINAAVNWAATSDADGTRTLFLTAVGSGFATRISQVPGTTQAIDQSGTYLIRLEPGVSAQLSAGQNSGSTINVDGRYFSIHWVGP